MGIWGYTGYYLGMAIRLFGGTYHVPRLRNLSVITCEYVLQDIETVIIDCASDFLKECRSTIDYPIYLRDDYEWYTAEFREWKTTIDSCFIIDISISDPFDPHLLVDILRDYILEFEVRVESIRKDLRECLIGAIRDRDCCKEIFYATMEDFDEMGRTYEVELTTLRVDLAQRDQLPSAMDAECT